MLAVVAPDDTVIRFLNFQNGDGGSSISGGDRNAFFVNYLYDDRIGAAASLPTSNIVDDAATENYWDLAGQAYALTYQGSAAPFDLHLI